MPIVIVLFGIGSELRGQSGHVPSAGLLAEYNQLTPQVNSYVADKYFISGQDGIKEGFRLGAFLQFQKNHGYWYSEASVISSKISLWFENLKPQEEPPDAYWTYTGSTYNNTMFSVFLARGIKAAGRFPLDGGLVFSHVQDDEKEDYPDAYFQSDPMLNSQKILYDFADDLRDFRMSARVRIGWEFGPLILRGTYERSLYSCSRQVEYNGTEYPVNLTTHVWSFSFSYTVYTRMK